MKTILFLICIFTFNAYSQDCHIPVLDYSPKEVVGNYSVYQFTPKKIKDSFLLITAVYDSVQMIGTKILHHKTHSMAGSYRDPGVDKIQFDVYKNVLSKKTYGEGEKYDGKYKYIGLNERVYNYDGHLVSESNYGTSNIPSAFVYADSVFEQAIKQNYAHRATPDCISRYQYKEGHCTGIENYMNGSLTFTNMLSYTAGNITQAKGYKPDGTVFSLIEFTYSPKGFTQTLYYGSEQNNEFEKEEDSYFWKYKKEQGRIVELSYGKNGTVIDRNEYVYNSKGRLVMVKMYDGKVLKYIHKYYYR
ncbi:hypothetical protein [Cytophaga hutchinsonii]|uniref:Uncharacterized protein n=1 Tax=Cytophaga hutchinsonii (strain ATCC 33406 / DSM 1761 / CIP 103989 / NBRC 15051 / NCIMB 9469 / D465) TaxID=269798 RepID=A0A6N4STK2_CYTH3|nr:hypothetical protein [Cytophaga hutchinsonii]ABG59645.1 hypothetical protein CHU_2388 [Cytophaga hutchinsonii ATCC 33406]SFX66661.1 hypothetical protein SAMN04487930_107144 [Cytophaga hutchinsonii ATCC 33406]